MMIVAIMTVRRGELEAFRSYERVAIRRMRAHGGRLENTVVVDDGELDVLREVHVVRFPDQHALEAYQSDFDMAAVRSLRERSVVDTQLLVGTQGPHY